MFCLGFVSGEVAVLGLKLGSVILDFEFIVFVWFFVSELVSRVYYMRLEGKREWGGFF